MKEELLPEEAVDLGEVARPDLAHLTEKHMELFSALQDALRGGKAAAQAQRDDLDALLDSIAQAQSDLTAIDVDTRLSHDQLQVVARIEKTARGIQDIMNHMNLQGAEYRATIQGMIDNIEHILEATEGN